MTRARAAWLAAGVVVLAAVGYLLRRRARRFTPVPALASASYTATVSPLQEPAKIAAVTEQSPIEEEPAVPPEVPDTVQEDERPLATWVRVAIIVAALVAFFAVSLIATKTV